MLTSKENKILSHIANNARISNKHLSKQVHISRELIDYHIKKLEKKQIIIGYQTRLNLNAFSILIYNILIKFQKYDEKEEKTFVEFIKKQNYTHFIAKIGGSYDYCICFSIKEVQDLRKYLDNLYENFSDLISKHELVTYIEEIKDDFASLFDKNKNNCNVSIKNYNLNFNLDQIDKKIIEKITNFAKISYVNLGKELNMTSAGISYRISKLEKNNIILGYRTIIDILKLEKQFYYVFFNVKNMTKLNEVKIIREFKINPNILFANRLVGKYSYVCMVVAKDNNSFYKILKEIQNNIQNIVNLEIFSILDFIHHNYIPKNFLN